MRRLFSVLSKFNRTFFISLVSFFLLHAGLAGAMGGNPFNRGWFRAVSSSASPVCAPSGAEEKVQTGLVKNDKPDTSEFIVLPKVYDFDNGQCTSDNPSSCYSGLFSTTTADKTKIFSKDEGAYSSMAGFGNISSDSSDSQHKWRALSGKNYARLFVVGPGSSDLVLKTIAFGDLFKFKIYKTSAELKGAPDVSGNVSGKVEIFYKGAVVNSQVLDESCSEVGTYENQTWDPIARKYKLLPQYFPPGVSAVVMKACPYEEISIGIPEYVQGQEVQVVWTLSATPQFQNSWERCPKRDASCACPMKELCSTFNPAVAYSIDDVGFGPLPAVSDFSCEQNDIDKGGDPRCKLSTPDQTTYFRVKQPSSSGANPTAAMPGLNGLSSFVKVIPTTDGFLASDFTEKGLYTVDVIGEGGILSNGKHAIYGVSDQKAVIRVADSSLRPTAARLTETTAVVFPPLTPPQCNPREPQRIISYEIYRLNSPGDPPRNKPIGVMEADEMVKNGFVDSQVVPNTQPRYAVKPVYDQGQKGPFSPWDQTHKDLRKVTANLGYSPISGAPAPLRIIADPAGRPLQTVRILRGLSIDKNRPNLFGFSGSPSNKMYTAMATLKPGNDSSFSAFAAYVDPNVETPQPELANYNDPKMPSTMDLPVFTSQDFTEKPWTAKQLLKAIEYMQLPGMELSQCQFTGNAFQCASQISAPATVFRIPTLAGDAMQTLTAYHYGKSQPNGNVVGGFLRCPECRTWLTSQAATLYGSPIDFTSVDPGNDCSLQSVSENAWQNRCASGPSSASWSYAASLATFDAVQMYKVLPDQDPNKCLLNDKCPARVLANLYGNQNNRYIESYLAWKSDQGGVLDSQTADLLAASSTNSISYFFSNLIKDYNSTNPFYLPLAQVVDSMHFVEPQNLNPQEQQSWTNVYKPYFERLKDLYAVTTMANAALQATAVTTGQGVFTGTLHLISGMLHTCVPSSAMGPQDVIECQKDEDNWSRKIENLGQEMMGKSYDDAVPRLLYDLGQFIPTATSVIAGGIGVAKAATAVQIKTTVPIAIKFSRLGGQAANDNVELITSTLMDATTGKPLGGITASISPTTNSANLMELMEPPATLGSSAGTDAEAAMLGSVTREGNIKRLELVVSNPENPVEQALNKASLTNDKLPTEAFEETTIGQAEKKAGLNTTEVLPLEELPATEPPKVDGHVVNAGEFTEAELDGMGTPKVSPNDGIIFDRHTRSRFVTRSDKEDPICKWTPELVEYIRKHGSRFYDRSTTKISIIIDVDDVPWLKGRVWKKINITHGKEKVAITKSLLVGFENDGFDKVTASAINVEQPVAKWKNKTLQPETITDRLKKGEDLLHDNPQGFRFKEQPRTFTP